MNAIVLGYRGKCDMLRQVFGGGEDSEPPPFSPDAFRSVFGK